MHLKINNYIHYKFLQPSVHTDGIMGFPDVLAITAPDLCT